MAKTKKYIVVKLEETYWTDPDANKPLPVPWEEAIKALRAARTIYPHKTYDLKEVK